MMVENDGYSAVQVGFGDKKEKIINKDKAGKKEIVHRHGATKAEMGHFKKAGVSAKRYVREFKFENADEYALAQEIKADIFATGDKVDATAISKGKGFQGAIKRHGQSRGPMAHGSKYHRHAGSNGAYGAATRTFAFGIINGSGKSLLNLAVALIDGLIGRIGIAYFLGQYLGMGPQGFWIGDAAAGFIPFLIGFTFFVSGRWKVKPSKKEHELENTEEPEMSSSEA